MQRSKLAGNGLWESSRLLLPEHREALIARHNEIYGGNTMSKKIKHGSKNDKSKRPTRDEFELEEIAEQLSEAKEEKTEVILTVWGEEEKVKGQITELDPRTRLVHVERYGEVTKVPFMDIMRVSTI